MNRNTRTALNLMGLSFSALRGLCVIITFMTAAASHADDDLTAESIVKGAHEAAGGEAWRQADSLILRGTASFYRAGSYTARADADSYTMWRQFPGKSTQAHAANGRVRFDAKAGDRTIFQISFDGETSYDQNGRIDDAAATERWKSNFGFGIIRFALDEGFSVKRMADDHVQGHHCYFVEVTDPTGKKTLFGVDQESFAIRLVGFDTPEGFHHRVYDNFYRNDGVPFTQPGHVRLYYDGVKTADIQWLDYELNPSIDATHFSLE